MQMKNMPIAVKAAGTEGGLADGQIVAYAAIFGNVDSYGDRMVKGSFAGTLTEWKDSGRVIPLLYGHNMSDPMMNLGGVITAEEDDRGLKITAEFDLDNPVAAQVYRLVKSGRLSELSFAFDMIDSKDVDGVREVTAVKLYECSLVPIGANPETEIIAVKSVADALKATADALKAGRTISAANESKLRDAADSMRSAIAAIETVLPSPEGDEKSPQRTQEQSSGHSPTPGATEPAAKSDVSPSDLLVAEFDFIPTPTEGDSTWA